MDEENKRIDITIAGCFVGTAAEWDEIEVCALQFTDFIPNERGTALHFEQCDNLAVYFDRGIIEHYKNNEIILVLRITSLTFDIEQG